MAKIDLKTSVLFLSGIIMIGHATRMIYQAIYRPGSYYSPNIFDIFFDWSTLLILGFFVLYYSIYKFHKVKKDKNI